MLARERLIRASLARVLKISQSQEGKHIFSMPRKAIDVIARKMLDAHAKLCERARNGRQLLATIIRLLLSYISTQFNTRLFV